MSKKRDRFETTDKGKTPAGSKLYNLKYFGKYIVHPVLWNCRQCGWMHDYKKLLFGKNSVFGAAQTWSLNQNMNTVAHTFRTKCGEDRSSSHSGVVDCVLCAITSSPQRVSNPSIGAGITHKKELIVPIGLVGQEYIVVHTDRNGHELRHHELEFGGCMMCFDAVNNLWLNPADIPTPTSYPSWKPAARRQSVPINPNPLGSAILAAASAGLSSTSMMNILVGSATAGLVDNDLGKVVTHKEYIKTDISMQNEKATGSIVGWKFLSIDEEGYLLSPVQLYRWGPENIGIRDWYKADSSGFTTEKGFYAFTNSEAYEGWNKRDGHPYAGDAIGRRTDIINVCAIVQGTGKVKVCESGFTATSMRFLAIFLDGKRTAGVDLMMERLRCHYTVPVMEWTQKRWDTCIKEFVQLDESVYDW